ncbi:hypothetical protein BDZ97DRAFT_2041742 [Flammula alnicola]|nr:hypothetical protein BDZ97DRAFT_2041742 [Flammula alnicola]
MKTCRFSDLHYIPGGKSRTETRKTIECCPFPEVDEELDYICKMAKQWIKSWQNPFATASWIHLVLVRCHPFETWVSPNSVSLTQRADYYAAINKAYEGDHGALVQCMLQGMKETITSVQSL